MNNKERLEILKSLKKYLIVEKVKTKYGLYERIVTKHLSPDEITFLSNQEDYAKIKNWLENDKSE